MLEPLKIMTAKLNAAADKAMAEINALEKELESMHTGIEAVIQCPGTDLYLSYKRYNGDRFRIILTSENSERPVAECKREEKIEAAKHLQLLITAIVTKVMKLIGEEK